MEASSPEGLGPAYASLDDPRFVPRYAASCLCGAVGLEYRADPVDAKLCHCPMCQALHGAPFQWAAIFEKRDVRLVRGLAALHFFDPEHRVSARRLPCKVSCSACGSLIADEGRNMWLAFPTLFDFGSPPRIPEAFRPTCHIFYGSRRIECVDDLPKWSGHKNSSPRL